MVKVRKNLTGQKFGKLLVLYQSEDLVLKNGKRKAMWHCICDCGNECNIRGEYLKNGHTTSCGCYNANFNDLTGLVFGRISVISYAGMDSKTKNALWNCKCKCGNTFTTLGVNLTRTDGIKTCKKCKVIDGKNDIPTIAPWMEKYFKNKEDIYKYTYGSSKKVLVQCLDCGKEKYIAIKDLYNHKSIGCICSDTVSYPEKFMFSFLEQLNVDFLYQYSPEWIGNKRYDFYIPSKNIIIEVDGGIGHGHRYTFGNYSMDELVEIDKYKDRQALKHNLKVVRINAQPSTYEVLIKSIKEKLTVYFDINDVDFLKCDEFGLTNLIKDICIQWDNIDNIQYFVDRYKLSDVTIRTYLKKGTKLGWCSYNPKEQRKKNILRSGKKIEVYKNECYLGEFNSCAEFARTFNCLQNEIKINPVSLAQAVSNNKKYKGFTVREV